MSRSKEEVMIREIAKSSCMRFGTTAPFAIGAVQIRRIGFADIPIVQVMVHCREDSKSCLVAIARSVVFKVLEEHGLESEILEFTPTVGSESSRQSIFVDENKSSESYGKRKRGRLYHFRFEIKKIHVGHFDWPSYRYGRFHQ